tara:strand:- start:95 stop:574 length:480 start_codon:yes stop_codon:yes gene_type:complete
MNSAAIFAVQHSSSALLLPVRWTDAGRTEKDIKVGSSSSCSRPSADAAVKLIDFERDRANAGAEAGAAAAGAAEDSEDDDAAEEELLDDPAATCAAAAAAAAASAATSARSGCAAASARTASIALAPPSACLSERYESFATPLKRLSVRRRTIDAPALC